MKPSEIIQRDINKNYPDRDISASSAILDFEKYKLNGGAYFSTATTIIILKYVGDSTIEFHTMNGGTGKDLTEAVNLMARKLSAKYDKVVTYYDNSRISELVKYSEFPASVKQIDDGLDRTYELTIELRSKNGRD